MSRERGLALAWRRAERCYPSPDLTSFGHPHPQGERAGGAAGERESGAAWEREGGDAERRGKAVFSFVVEGKTVDARRAVV
jgi:hypothetical protein